MSNHDVIVRMVFLLPEGVTQPDWDSARAALAAYDDAALEALAGDSINFQRWTEDREEAEGQATGALNRAYLAEVLADAEASWAAGEPAHDGISLERYPGEWHGRIGILCQGYGFDEVPAGVESVVDLDEARLLDAAGFERMP